MKLPRDIARSTSWASAASHLSGIAEVLINLGYVVQGSDAAAENANVKRLREKGANISIGTFG